MGQQASVTLNAVVYSPAGSANGTAKWVNRSGGVLNSFSTLQQTFAEASGSKKLTRVNFRLDVPVVATADSTCACTGSLQRTASVQISVWMDPAYTAAERTDLAARIKDLAASGVFTAAVADLDPAYA